MSNDNRPAFHLYVDGIDYGVFHGWKNIRAAIAKYEAKGHEVALSV